MKIQYYDGVECRPIQKRFRFVDYNKLSLVIIIQGGPKVLGLITNILLPKKNKT